MNRPQHLLVVITRDKPIQPALERALLFGQQRPINITLFSAVFDPALELTSLLAPVERKALREQALKARKDYLDQLCTKYKNSNVSFTFEVVWHKKTAQAIVEFTQDHAVDLTIKRISSDANSENPFIMPTDWHLLRFCNSPLLLVKDANWHNNKPVLAAICPTSESSEHRELNHHIIDYTQFLAEVLASEAHVVNSYISPRLDAPLELSACNNEELRKKVASVHLEKVNELVSKHPFSEQHIHVVEGLPETKIPEIASNIGAQLVVMGTVGRTGLTAAFMGNTAERVLAKLKCEVLALKPKNFES